LAQGPLVAGGYSFDSELNSQQRNYPTSAVLQGGATVETPVDAQILKSDGDIAFLLNDPDFATAQRIADSINSRFGIGAASVRNADEVRIHFRGDPARLPPFVAEVENVGVTPDQMPRVVINEKTGTVVAGADVMISSVVISQGDIKVTVTAEKYASQPSYISGFARDVRSLVVTNTKLDVEQGTSDAVVSFPSTAVADLVEGLAQANVGTRRTISILQAIKAAGALHADIIVQ
jgi:flagellar P-ring protein precursor FlgI